MEHLFLCHFSMFAYRALNAFPSALWLNYRKYLSVIISNYFFRCRVLPRVRPLALRYFWLRLRLPVAVLHEVRPYSERNSN